MTIPIHMLSAYIISKSLGLSTGLCAFNVITSALPDIIGFSEKLYSKFIKHEKWEIAKNKWNWYEQAHNIKSLNLCEWILFFAISPFYVIHIFADYLTHNPKPPFGWYKWAYYLEVVLYILCGAWFYYFFK